MRIPTLSIREDEIGHTHARASRAESRYRSWGGASYAVPFLATAHPMPPSLPPSLPHPQQTHTTVGGSNTHSIPSEARGQWSNNEGTGKREIAHLPPFLSSGYLPGTVCISMCGGQFDKQNYHAQEILEVMNTNNQARIGTYYRVQTVQHGPSGLMYLALVMTY